MEAYLDNSATTQCLESVTEVMVKVMREDFGNPSSKHMKGVEAERYLREARETIARTLKVNEKEIFFTSGGTESDNWALLGAARANQRAGRHLITTAVEHPAVLMPMGFLEEQGFEVTYLPVDRRGHISLADLEAALREDTILVSMMMVNNEVGTIEPVEEAGRLIKSRNPKTLFHVDGIQAYGKLRIYPKRTHIDMLSVSGHKINGPKGTGFLYVDNRVKLKPLIYGGGQQRGMRSGTDNVPGAAGLGEAAARTFEHFDRDREHLLALKARMLEGLERLAYPDGPANAREEAASEAQAAAAISGQANAQEKVISKAQAMAVTSDQANAQEKAVSAARAAAATGGQADGSAGKKRKPLVVVNSEPGELGAPHIVSAAFPGVRSEVLLHALEDKGIYVSAGSACSSNKKLPVSTVLKELGLEPELLESTLRFSFSRFTTQEEIDYCLQCLGELLPVLRRYARH